ncbi:MAG: protamine-2 (modular protein) [Mesorhizobium sp.]|nr:MAG: protamine-2 (modular protein) [Mesorhizobium sp.]TIU41502.1 MAG: protamine-2 (modular protein) [Mesorhizobium sp.]
MDRRSFLTAMFGVAGAAALASAVRPIDAVAGVPGAGRGILDELETPQTATFDEDAQAEVQQVYHRDWHHRPHRRRRRGWRRVCRSYWRHGRRRVGCYRRRGPSVVLRF